MAEGLRIGTPRRECHRVGPPINGLVIQAPYDRPMLSQATRHGLIRAGFAAIDAVRADRWLAPAARGRGVILTFHHVRPEGPGDGFAPNRLLSVTPDFLDRALGLVRARGFEIVPLDAVPDRLASRGQPFVALTFDDGYRDNLAHAAPVLTRHGAPWTLFVTSDFADGRGRLWWIELEEAVRRLDRVTAAGLDLPSRDAAEKSAAFAALYRRLRAGPEETLLKTIAGLARQAGIESEWLVGELCLGWGEIAGLARAGVAIGAHTVAHPMLAKHDAARARREIVEGRARIEARLGQPVRHLAYPVGDPGSAGQREFALAREAGFATAVTTRPGHLFPAHRGHLHALPRVSVNGLFQSEAALGALLSGVPFLAWNRGRRVNVS